MLQKNISPVNCATVHTVKWPVKDVLAMTTTRHHPFDLNGNKNAYSHFNLGLHVGDQAEQVLNNRASLATLLSSHLTPKTTVNIQWLDQVHGSNVIYLNEEDSFSTLSKVADAIITRQKKVALAIMTADCLPILLSANDGSEIAAIHGGWKPLAKNIIEKTLAKMITPKDQISAWLGPCIGLHAFEVGEEVRDNFIQQSTRFGAAFTKIEAMHSSSHRSINKTPIKYLANLYNIAQEQLTNSGIKNISQLTHCTFTMAQDYYSYRRDGKTGRMATIITRR